MRYIGAHVSIAGGVQNAPGNASDIGANAMAIFTKNQRQWNAPALTAKAKNAFKQELASHEIDASKVVVHDSYLINIGNPEPEKRERALKALVDEAQRVQQLGLELLNIHPGSHLKKISESDCIKLIAQGVDHVLQQVPAVTMVLEITAGQGTNIGYSFEQLAEIIEHSEYAERVGVCIDTCHMFGAGYDIRSKKAYEQTFREFERVIGLSKLRAFHINDSLTELGSKKDRHASLGKGEIGLKPFKRLIQDERFADLPFVLETKDPSLWPQEISMLRKAASR